MKTGKRNSFFGKSSCVVLAVFLIGLLTFVNSGYAQPYPSKTIQLIVPFPPGGSTDLTGRMIANYLSQKWGQTISVINKPGASGTTGVMAALKSKNDGYTMLMNVISSGTLNPAIESKLPYKWNEPTFVARTNISPLVFIVQAGSPWKNLKEVVEDVKKDPSKFKYGTSGIGGPSTFSMAQLLDAGGIDPKKVGRVVLQGGAPAVVAVAGGHVDFASQNLSEVISLLEAKKIKALAVTTPQRVKQLQEVPTSKEAGYEEYNLLGWNGISGPADLPGIVIKRWSEDIRALMGNPKFIEDMEMIGAPPAYLGPEEFKASLEKEYYTALKFAEKLGIRK